MELIFNTFDEFKYNKEEFTVFCPNGANAPRYRGCLSAICYGTEAIKVSGSLRLIDKIDGGMTSNHNESIHHILLEMVKKQKQ